MRLDDYFDLDAIKRPFGGGRRSRQQDDDPQTGSGRRTRSRRDRPGRRWRWLRRGDLKFAILALIRERPMHGYEVMQVLEEESGGNYRASPGSVYPTLQHLEDLGQVAARSHDGRRVYSITDEGRAYLEEHRDTVRTIFERASERIARDASGMRRRFVRLTRATFQGAAAWVEDDRLYSDMKGVLDRAVKDMEAAWDAARGRRQDARKARECGEAPAKDGTGSAAAAAEDGGGTTESAEAEDGATAGSSATDGDATAAGAEADGAEGANAQG